MRPHWRVASGFNDRSRATISERYFGSNIVRIMLSVFPSVPSYSVFSGARFRTRTHTTTSQSFDTSTNVKFMPMLRMSAAKRG
jgi:hypothetical protein